MSDCINEYIDALPSNYKTVLVLSDLEGLANKEVAEILGISEDNAKIRIHRARTRLKKALKSGCDYLLHRGERPGLRPQADSDPAGTTKKHPVT
jgi:RNA polymerase sigma-70 factor, ECF subfamily